MPAAALQAGGRLLEPLASHGRVRRAGGRQIQADAAHTGLAHGVEIALRRFFVDHGDAPGVGAARSHAEQRRRIVGAVDARGDDHHALDMQRLVQRRHFLGRCQLNS